MSVTASRDLTLYGHRLLRRISLPGEPTKWRCQCLNCGAEYDRAAVALYREHNCGASREVSEAKAVAPRREPRRVAPRSRPKSLNKCPCGADVGAGRSRNCSDACAKKRHSRRAMEREAEARGALRRARLDAMVGPSPLVIRDTEGNVAGWLGPLRRGRRGPEPWVRVVGGSLTAEEKADMGPYRPERAQVAR